MQGNNILRESISNVLDEIVRLCNLRVSKEFRLKEDNSIVTHIDEKITEYIESLLRDNTILISEENKNRDTSKAERVIILDPIDGTENFISGSPLFGVSFSSYLNGKHEFSFLYFPRLDKFAGSSKGYVTKGNLNFKSRIVALSSSMSIEEIMQFKSDKYEEYRITGCCVYNIYNVMKGVFKSYRNKRAWVWDFIGGFNIAINNGIDVFVNGEKYEGQLLDCTKRYDIEIRN